MVPQSFSVLICCLLDKLFVFDLIYLTYFWAVLELGVFFVNSKASILATTTIEPDSDLEQMRAWIERFSKEEEEEDVSRGKGWGLAPGGEEVYLLKKWLCNLYCASN